MRLEILLSFFLAHSIFATNKYESIFLQQHSQIEKAYESYLESIKEDQRKLSRVPPELLESAMFNSIVKARYDRLDAAHENYVAKTMAPLCNLYSWAIPNDEALLAIINRGPLVELGAGLGYWAHLIREQGGDIIAYDNFSWESATGHKNWCDVKVGTPKVLSYHQDRTLLLCWPPQDAMAFKALKFFKGHTLIYIGETRNGAMADEQFFELLEREFSEVDSIKIPNWPGYSDKVVIYERKNEQAQ